MNKNLIPGFLAAFLLLFGTASAASSYDNALSLVNVSVSPNPVIAGGTATIRFQLYNSFGFWLYNVNLQSGGSYPILNVSPRSSYTIGQINGGLNPSYFNYTFAIPNSTPSGVYKLSFNATYYALGASAVIATSSMPVSFYVQNKPAIKVSLSGPQPAALYSGYNQTVQLAIQNTGYGTARNVSVTVHGGQGINLLSSVTTFFVSNLTQGSAVNEPILVAAQNVGQTGILANITYYSSNLNRRFYSVQNLNLSVAPSAQFGISSISSTLAPGVTNAAVNLRVTNTGTSSATGVVLSLQSSYPLTPITGTYYISSLTPGASANATFLLNVDSQGVPGNYPVTVYEQWKQPNGALNQQFSGSNNYFVTIGNQGGSATLIAAIVVVIIVVGALVYRSGISGKKQKGKK